MKPAAANFNLIARPYRWMEVLTLGRALERCRNYFLPDLVDCRSALVLGDGDGRFLAALLAANPTLQADVVDASDAMLRLLERRAHAAHPTAATRFHTHHTDALAFAPTGPYDLIVTHFFLDCLTTPEVDRLCTRIVPHLEPNARWLISDFRIPAGPMHWPARILVRLLYLAFRLLAGLRTTHLPDYTTALLAADFGCIAAHISLAGLLTTELWEYTPAMQLPPQRPRTAPLADPVPDPEPASPSLPEPDPAVFHPAPDSPACETSQNPADSKG
jgi:SAM-dependent methyltransferase